MGSQRKSLPKTWVFRGASILSCPVHHGQEWSYGWVAGISSGSLMTGFCQVSLVLKSKDSGFANLGIVLQNELTAFESKSLKAKEYAICGGNTALRRLGDKIFIRDIQESASVWPGGTD